MNIKSSITKSLDFASRLAGIGCSSILLYMVIISITNGGEVMVYTNEYGEMWLDLAVFSSFFTLIAWRTISAWRSRFGPR